MVKCPIADFVIAPLGLVSTREKPVYGYAGNL